MTVGVGAWVVAAEEAIDGVRLDLDPGTLLILNVILGLIMFGVALDIDPHDVTAALREPLAPVLGIVLQLVALPLLTFLLSLVLPFAPSVLLGMILVSACPGGALSNVVAHLAGANVVLSIGMTTVSTLAATVMTPLNLAVWGRLNPRTNEVLRAVALDPMDVFLTILVVLGLPVAAGLLVRQRHPAFAARWVPRLKKVSASFLGLFILAALLANLDAFGVVLVPVVVAVVVHNLSALTLGYLGGGVFHVGQRERRAIAIEVGMQNTALALTLSVTFFEGLGGITLVAALWGLWHLVSGAALAWYWGRHAPAEPTASPPVSSRWRSWPR
ncbi:MAG TPA: bile acid:sodium symporter family protein [Nitriliruptorales bacterium]